MMYLRSDPNNKKKTGQPKSKGIHNWQKKNKDIKQEYSECTHSYIKNEEGPLKIVNSAITVET